MTGLGALNGLPAGTVMGHVHLKVAAIAPTVGFYREVLGFGLMPQLGRQAALSAPAATTITSAPTPGERRREGGALRAAALRHVTIVLPSLDERERLLRAAAAAGAGPEETTAGPMLTDPSGNRLLLAVAADST